MADRVYVMATIKPWNIKTYHEVVKHLPGRWHLITEPDKLTVRAIEALSPRYVFFPHWSHRDKYTCQVCHLELDFGMPRGESNITRGGNLAGRHCGACHNGQIAFSVKVEDKHCDRCHIENYIEMDRKFDELAVKMPRTKYGNKIDWSEALEKGLIQPKNSLYDDNLSMSLPEVLKKPLRLGTSSPRSSPLVGLAPFFGVKAKTSFLRGFPFSISV